METRTVKIRCKNNNNSKTIRIGSTLLEIYREFSLELPSLVVCAKVDNKVEGLNYRAYNDHDVEFLDLTTLSGTRTYARSLFFLLIKAVEDLFPGGEITITSAVSRGYYCQLNIGHETTEADIMALKQRMKDLVREDLPFHRRHVPTEEAIQLFTERGMMDKVRLIETSGKLYSYYYQLEESVNYFYGALCPRTGMLTLFDVVPYYDGLLLRTPDMKNPTELNPVIKQEKMLNIFQTTHRRQQLVGMRTVGDFNQACREGRATEVINVSEAIQERQLALIAEQIQSRPEVKMVLISGPSSSGKTTTSKRLSIQLMACGLRPYAISLDDYFVNREDTPRDETGDYDFESLYALDIPFFNAQLTDLLAGKEVTLPRYNFQTGKRETSGNKLKINDQTILILEGIHALNPTLTEAIPDNRKFRIYASALTSILLDNHNYIPTTDNRLLRRIIRDSKYRGMSAEDTIKRWPSVRRGEDKWIFPFQENADAMFNTALVFELAVIRTQALPLLEEVPENSPVYSEAYRLRKFLTYFHPLADRDLPPTSLLREFLGGSSFTY